MLLTLLAFGAAYIGIVAWLDHRQIEDARLQRERVLQDFHLESGSNYPMTGYCYQPGDYMRHGDVYRQDGTRVEAKRPRTAFARAMRRQARKAWHAQM